MLPRAHPSATRSAYSSRSHPSGQRALSPILRSSGPQSECQYVGSETHDSAASNNDGGRWCVHCDVVDLGGGAYELSATSTKAGTYDMCIRLDSDEDRSCVSLSKSAQQLSDDAQVLERLTVEPAHLTDDHGKAGEVMCKGIEIVAGIAWPPACKLQGDGLTVGYEGDESCFKAVAYDQHGNMARVGGERLELRAYKLLPGGIRRPTSLKHAIHDNNNGSYTVSYTPHEPGRWELYLIRDEKLESPASLKVGNTDDANGHTEVNDMDAVIGGRSFVIVVRPAIARNLSNAEAIAAMEAHTRAEAALACVATGSGLEPCTAGEVRTFTVRMPPRPMCSPPHRLRCDDRGYGMQAVGSTVHAEPWSATEQRVLDQASLVVTGTIERAPGSGAEFVPNTFVLNEVKDNGDGTWHVSYTAFCAGSLHLSIELAGGGMISGAPFKIFVAAAAMVPAESSLNRDKLQKNTTVGVANFVEAFARDRFGNALPFEASTYEIRVFRTSRKSTSPRRGEISPHSHGPEIEATAETIASNGSTLEHYQDACEVVLSGGLNGGCQASFTLLEPGSYVLHAVIGGHPLAESPLPFLCGAGHVEPSCCTLLEVGARDGSLLRVSSTAGGRLWIQTRDSLANARASPLVQPIWCELRGLIDEYPEAITCVVVDLGDGCVEVTYPPTVPVGLYAIFIGLFADPSDQSVDNVVLDATVGRFDPAADSASRVVAGSSLEPTGATADVHTGDACQREAEVIRKAYRTEHCVGRLRMVAAIHFAGDATVISPSIVRVKAGVMFDILVSPVDEAGRQCATSSESLRAQLSSGPAPVAMEVSRDGPGAYRVSTVVQVSGEYRITFSLNGLQVAGSPISLIAARQNSRPPVTAMISTSTTSGPQLNSPRPSCSPRLGKPRPTCSRSQSPRSTIRPIVTRSGSPSLSLPRATTRKAQHHSYQ